MLRFPNCISTKSLSLYRRLAFCSCFHFSATICTECLARNKIQKCEIPEQCSIKCVLKRCGWETRSYLQREMLKCPASKSLPFYNRLLSYRMSAEHDRSTTIAVFKWSCLRSPPWVYHRTENAATSFGMPKRSARKHEAQAAIWKAFASASRNLAAEVHHGDVHQVAWFCTLKSGSDI